MSRRYPPYQLVTLDRDREPIRTGYVMAGLYGGFCRCGYFVTFERRESITDCPRCKKRFTTEEAMRPWLESRQRMTTTPLSRPPSSGRHSEQRWRNTPSAPRPTVQTKPTKGQTEMPNETPSGDPQLFDQEEEAVHHEEEEPEEPEEE